MAGKASKAAGKANKPDSNKERQISKNRRAHFDYELGERFEAGVSLVGSEARSLRENAADLRDAWVDVKGGQAFVKGMRIPPLVHAFMGHEETRPRRLLLHRAEIEKLQDAVERDRMTLVVTRAYFRNGKVKIEIAVAKGKKLHDKRHTMKERAATREARDAIRRGKGG